MESQYAVWNNDISGEMGDDGGIFLNFSLELLIKDSHIVQWIEEWIEQHRFNGYWERKVENL